MAALEVPGANLRAAWDRFRTAQEQVREWTEATPRFRDNPNFRAKGYHALFEAMAMSYNQAIAPRLYRPRIFYNIAWQTDVYTLGQNGPDLNYATTYLDGKFDYRLTGRYSDLVLILVQVMNHISGHPDSRVIGNHDLGTFEINSDGTFEFILSATEKPGNWIPLVGDSTYNYVLIRRFLTDSAGDLGEMNIERIEPISRDYYDADEFEEGPLIERIDRAADFLKYLVQYFNIGLYDFYVGNANGTNRMQFLPRTVTSEIASPSCNYAMAIYDLEDDEALVIELDTAPDGVYWGFQLGNVWSRSLNLLDSQTNLNMTQIAVDSDGAVRVIISRQDTGLKNWLDTTGFSKGAVVFRNYRTEKEPVPKTTKVKVADLAKFLPADTARVTPEQRIATIRRIGKGLLKHFGE